MPTTEYYVVQEDTPQAINERLNELRLLGWQLIGPVLFFSIMPHDMAIEAHYFTATLQRSWDGKDLP